MNFKNYNIVIIEPSCVIYTGLNNILTQKKKNYHISRSYDLAELDKSNIINNVDLVIVNFSAVQNQFKLFKSLRKENEKVKWVTLINSFYDLKDLDLFDAYILINDTEEKIINVINKLIDLPGLTTNETKQDTLSAREIEILKLLVTGLSAKEIAEKLFLSTHTVVTHRKNISQKTGIKSIAGLTVYAILNNIVEPEKYG